MARLIDADELMKKAEHIPTGIRFMGIRLEFHGVTASAIENAPTIDPESLRPRAHWIRKRSKLPGGELTVVECSLCECQQWNETNFCPICGAKMKG